MEIRKTMIPHSSKGEPITGAKEREYIYFTVRYNHFRDVSDDIAHEMRDREEWAEWTANPLQRFERDKGRDVSVKDLKLPEQDEEL